MSEKSESIKIYSCNICNKHIQVIVAYVITTKNFITLKLIKNNQ